MGAKHSTIGLELSAGDNLGDSGVAILRLTADSVLHSRVKVELSAASGVLSAAHIHEAAAGVNGPVKIFLAHNISEFDVFVATKLTADQYRLLLDESKHL